jgi:hypothetical protein
LDVRIDIIRNTANIASAARKGLTKGAMGDAATLTTATSMASMNAESCRLVGALTTYFAYNQTQLNHGSWRSV